ncbi:MAG: adenylyl-sulfate kinase [Bacteroidales bacterium]|nr:adenylyl-sulfate kinase [Bacteroidales bacterium]
MTNNIVPIFDKMLNREQKQFLLHQKSLCIWFTGLSGSGKSTLALALENFLFKQGYKTALLDGDNVRHGINNDLGFSEKDRIENIRRIAEINKLFIQNGIITINTFVSPTNTIRRMAKEIIGSNDFYLIYTKASIETCENRDVKGLYQKARQGEIQNFTGISSVFEEPIDASLVVDTDSQTELECLNTIIEHILPKIKL